MRPLSHLGFSYIRIFLRIHAAFHGAPSLIIAASAHSAAHRALHPVLFVSILHVTGGMDGTGKQTGMEREILQFLFSSLVQ